MDSNILLSVSGLIHMWKYLVWIRYVNMLTDIPLSTWFMCNWKSSEWCELRWTPTAITWFFSGDAVETFWSVGLLCIVWSSVQCRCRSWIWVTIKIRCEVVNKNIRYSQQIEIKHKDLQGKCGLYRLDVVLLNLCVHMCVFL